MGRLAAPYGIKGFIRVQVFTEAVDGLLDYPVWLVGRGGEWLPRKVLQADVRGDGLVALFEGVSSREEALTLRGSEVAVRRDDLPPAGADEFYWDDLIGCQVVNREAVALGEVSGLIETGANDVLVVKGDRERLIPWVAAVVGEVDLAARTIRVDWPEDY